VKRAGNGLWDEAKVMLGGEPVVDEKRIGSRIYESVGWYRLGIGGEGDRDDEVCLWVEDGGESEWWRVCGSREWLWAPWRAQAVASSET
jgi:hypothetical protein